MIADSKRTQIAKAFFDLVAATSPPEEKVWRKKERHPILRVGVSDCPAFYTFDFQEQVTQLNPQKGEIVTAQVYMILEFWVHHKLSEEPGDLLNSILWQVQRAVATDNALKNLCSGVDEVGSKFKVDSAEQQLVSCESAFRITYTRKGTG